MARALSTASGVETDDKESGSQRPLLMMSLLCAPSVSMSSSVSGSRWSVKLLGMRACGLTVGRMGSFAGLLCGVFSI